MRRTLLALLAAMALVWLVLLGQAALDHYRAMDENPGVHQLARGLAGALAGLEQPAQAQALVQGMAYTLNSLRKDVDLLQSTKVLLQLQDRAGQLLHSSTTGLAAVVTVGDVRVELKIWISSGSGMPLPFRSKKRMPDRLLMGWLYSRVTGYETRTG